jgi:hypothetical protein
MSTKQTFPLLVTDHAILRYLERVKGHRFEIHNNKVVTVTSGHSAPSMTGRAITQGRIKR